MIRYYMSSTSDNKSLKILKSEILKQIKKVVDKIK